MNFNSDLIWKIKHLRMKQIYPLDLFHGSGFNKSNIELYRFGIPHYQNVLKYNQIS